MDISCGHRSEFPILQLKVNAMSFRLLKCLGSIAEMGKWKKDSRSSIFRIGIMRTGSKVVGDEHSSNRPEVQHPLTRLEYL